MEMEGKTRPSRPGKRAVILVHGMGEQVPLETIRAFADALWAQDAAVPAREATEPLNPVWTTPDLRDGAREMARLTTRGLRLPPDGRPGQRTDFIEFYWADLATSNSWDHLKDWFAYLLWRWPWTVPRGVLPVWWTLWGAVALFGVAAGGLALHGAGVIALAPATKTAFTLLGLALAVVTPAFLVPYFGDVARYVRAKPANIAVRAGIRRRGIDLLRQISNDPGYERIILVAHSLGSIVAYDILRLFWQEVVGELDLDATADADLLAALAAVEEAARLLAKHPSDVHRADFMTQQRALAAALARRRTPKGDRWLVTDFVTLGSPLAYAEFLLARDRRAFDRRTADREFPTCPPTGEAGAFSYRRGVAADAPRRLHHSAPFAAVRWHNLYDAPVAVLIGDPFSGPLADVWGPGVADVAVQPRGWWGLPRVFTHTGYWHCRPGRASSSCLTTLRRVLALKAP